MTAVEAPQRDADPGAIWGVIHGYTAYWSVVTAIDLGVFDVLAAGPLTCDALAAECGCVAARLRPLLDALAGLGLLERDPTDRYALSTPAATFLVAGAPRSMRELVVQSPGPRANWERFAGTLRGAAVPRPLGAGFYAELVGATAPTQRAAAAALAPSLPHYSRLLDLGAGAAPWTIALLEHAPDATATINDLPGVVEIGREAVRTAGLLDRVDVVEGDYHTAAFAVGAYDLVVCAHVLRAESPDGVASLLARARAALRPGGTLVVADYFVDDDRRGPLNALLLGATMAASVPGAATHTETAYREWLAGAGFVAVERHRPVPFQEVLVGRAPQEAAHAR